MSKNTNGILYVVRLGRGTARSDAVVVVYLQLARDAKRVYATAVDARANNEGFRLEGAVYPTNGQQIELFKETLERAKIDPDDVDYVESSACGDQVTEKRTRLLYADSSTASLYEFRRSTGHRRILWPFD